MKKISAIMTFLLSSQTVLAQSTFVRAGKPLSDLFDAVSRILSAKFLSEAYQLEALIRLALFIITYVVLRSIFRQTLGRENFRGAGTGAILEARALNVLAVVIAISTAFFVPIEFLFRGAALLLGFLIVGLAAAVYLSFRVGGEGWSRGALAGARLGILFALFVAVGVLAGIVDNLPTMKIGDLQLSSVPDINKTQEILQDFVSYSYLGIIIMAIINLIALLMHRETITEAEGVPLTRAGLETRRGERAETRERATETTETTKRSLAIRNKIRAARTTIIKLSEELQGWQKNIKKGEFAKLKNTSTEYQELVDNLLDYENVLKAELTRVPKELKEFIAAESELAAEETNILNILPKLEITQRLAALYADAEERTDKERMDDTILRIKQAIAMLNKLLELNEKEGRLT